MPDPPRSGDQPVPTAAMPAALHRLLDTLETAVIEGDQEQVAALSEQLWPQRRHLPAVLGERLRTGRTDLPGLALDLLIGYAGTRAPTLLKRLAQDPAVPDIVRWGARRRAGWAERGEAKARLAFLQSLHDPDATLVEATAQAGETVLPNTDVLEEVLAYLLVLPADRRLAVVQRAHAEAVPQLAWLLRALLHAPDPALARLALDILLEQRDRAAVGALDRLVQTTLDPALREAATTAGRRLRLQVVAPTMAPAAPAMPLPWVPVERVLASIIDGAGGQVVVLSRVWQDGAQLLATLFWTDHQGVRDAWGSFRQLPDEEGEVDLLAEFEETMTMVPIDLAGARGILAAAVQASAAAGRPLPPALELWAPFFHDTFPPAADEPVGAAELAEAPDAARPELVRRSAQLLDHPNFDAWFFNPEELAPLLAQVPLPRQGRLGERQYGPLIQGLVDPATRERLRVRLRRQAWLLAQRGEGEARDLALAVAASLARATPASLVSHPFLRAMIDRSLAVLAAAVGDR